MQMEPPEDVVEWVRYHRNVGVSRIYLRVNLDQIPEAIKVAVAPLVHSGVLDIGTKPGSKHPTQNRWYNECASLAHDFDWVAFIDLDEYIVVLDEGVPAHNTTVPQALAHFAAFAGVSVQWVFFGSAGHVERPDGGALANYDKCTGKLDIGTKCFANMKHSAPPLFRGDKAVHHCSSAIPARDGTASLQAWPQVLADGAPLTMREQGGPARLAPARTFPPFQNRTTYDPTITPQHRLVLYHFVTRSWRDYWEKKAQRKTGCYFTFEFQRDCTHEDDMLSCFQELEEQWDLHREHAVCILPEHLQPEPYVPPGGPTQLHTGELAQPDGRRPPPRPPPKSQEEAEEADPAPPSEPSKKAPTQPPPPPPAADSEAASTPAASSDNE